MFTESVQGHDGASAEPLINIIGHGVGEIQILRCRPNPLPRLAQGGSRGQLGVHKHKYGPCGAGRMITESVQGHADRPKDVAVDPAGESAHPRAGGAVYPLYPKHSLVAIALSFCL